MSSVKLVTKDGLEFNYDCNDAIIIELRILLLSKGLITKEEKTLINSINKYNQDK